ncbi:MAG: HmuY family protein [Cytophagales bacterium]
MIKKLIIAKFLCSCAIGMSQKIDSVTVSSGYQNQVWYSLENGIEKTQAKDDWDLGFEISGYAASVIANTQKSNFLLYKSPYSVLQFSTIDTTAINTWKKLYNSDTTWSEGALNSTRNLQNQFDLGWGTYDMNTHFVNGDSCYVVKISSTLYKKFYIENLAGGNYTLVVSNLDGSEEKSIVLKKSDFKNKNFGYVNLTSGEIIDREPETSSWDLTFTRYTSMLNSNGTIIPYNVVGVLQNSGVSVSQIDTVSNFDQFQNTTTSLSNNISTIGYDWKTFDLATNQWILAPNTVYIVKDKKGNLWKIQFIGFEGSASGKIKFKKELLNVTSLESENLFQTALSVFPNPAITQEEINFKNNSGEEITLNIYNPEGAIVYTTNLSNSHFSLNTNNFKSGIYTLKYTHKNTLNTQKLIIVK